MKWKKLGQIFNTEEYGQNNDRIEFAQSPQALVFDDFVRIYFSTRKRDSNGFFLSHIQYVDTDINFSAIISISDKYVISLGELGCFDEHGIFPINPLRIGDKIYAYTCGWSRRTSVPVETSTGLAISNDNGKTFAKSGMGPVLTSSLHEPMLVGDSFVQFFNDEFHMWYIFGKCWKQAARDEPPARIYKIAHATSQDGINWKKEEAQQIISDVLNEDECQALPSVVQIGSRYHMYFCYRQATDFRSNPTRGYRLGYAWSDDLVNWVREDKKSGIDVSAAGWDSEMMCYPHIFHCHGKVYLLYNGNAFGKHGFGIAILENE